MTCHYCNRFNETDPFKPHLTKAHWRECLDGGVIHDNGLYWCQRHRKTGFMHFVLLKRSEHQKQEWVKVINSLKDLAVHRFGQASAEAQRAEIICRAYAQKTAINVEASVEAPTALRGQ